MSHTTTFVGLDVHKATIQVALAVPGREVETWQIAHTPAAIKRLVGRLRKAGGDVRCCYEAGPCGYALQRNLRSEGIDCIVIAPSLIPSKPGDRIKTDRRDAVNLAKLHRAGLLTEVHPPTRDEEALRDLCRCREDTKQDLTRCRHRLQKFLLRRGVQYTKGKRAWTQVHRTWLRGVSFDEPAAQATFDQYLGAVEHLENNVAELERLLEEFAELEPYREPVGRLRCFRGIATVTAVTPQANA